MDANLPQETEKDPLFRCAVELLDLPDELLAQIFSYIDGYELASVGVNVCERFRYIISNDHILWENASLLWDTKVTNVQFFQFVPELYSICVRHSGLLSIEELISIFRTLFKKYKNLLKVQLECYDVMSVYGKSFLDALQEGCAQTLTHLSLNGPLVDDIYVSNFPKLTNLKLNENTDLHGEHLRGLCDNCPALVWLSIPKAHSIRDDEVCYFLQKKQDVLVGLEVSGYRLSDIPFLMMPKLVCFVHLGIRDSRNLTREALRSIAHVTKIEYLSLRRLRLQSEELIDWFCSLRVRKNLRVLDLQFAYNFGDHEAMSCISIPNLRYLYATNFSVSERTRNCVRSTMKNLVYIGPPPP